MVKRLAIAGGRQGLWRSTAQHSQLYPLTGWDVHSQIHRPQGIIGNPSVEDVGAILEGRADS
jgi:hypothetical protein